MALHTPDIATVIEKSGIDYVVIAYKDENGEYEVPQTVTSGTLEVGDRVYSYGGLCRKATPEEIEKYEYIEDETIISCEKEIKIEW